MSHPQHLLYSKGNITIWKHYLQRRWTSRFSNRLSKECKVQSRTRAAHNSKSLPSHFLKTNQNKKHQNSKLMLGWSSQTCWQWMLGPEKVLDRIEFPNFGSLKCRCSEMRHVVVPRGLEENIQNSNPAGRKYSAFPPRSLLFWQISWTE